nr:hypothetical protein [Tanacetum cinerariifolium]
MLESKAYKTYYAFASKEKTPKPKYVRKKADFDTSPKQKPVQATKGTIIKTKAKVAKSDKKKQPAKKPKAKGLAVLSEVALTEAEQLKLATKRSKKDFHISHASGSGDGVDTQSKVPDEQQQKTSSTDERTGTILGVPDVPIYASESNKKSWGDSDKDDDDDDEDDFEDDADNNDDDSDDNGGIEDHDDDSDDEKTKSDRGEIPDPNLNNVDQTEHEEENVDERVHSPSDYELTDDEKIHDKENIKEEEWDEVTKELYDDVNVNLGNKDTEMTNVDQGAIEQQNASHLSGFKQEEEDNHVTLTLVLDTQKTGGPTQISYVSFDFTSKLVNLTNPSPANNEIASLMDTTAYHATAIPEITLSSLLNIPAIVDRYMDNKLGEEKNKAIKAHNFVFREEAQAEKKECIELVDSTARTIIKEEVNARLPQILPQAISDVATPVIEKNVTESLEAAVLTRSSSQPQSSYEAAATLFEFELTKILIDKMVMNKSFDVADYKRELYDVLVKSYNTDKDIFESYGVVFSLNRSRDDKDKDQDPSAGLDRGTKRRKSSMQKDQEFVTGDNDEQPADKEVTKADRFRKPERPPTPDPD